MANLSKNFKSEEFRCNCGKCGMIKMSPVVVLVWQMVRDHFGKSVNINSGNRCIDYNRLVGGKAKSMHLPDSRDVGHASDGVVKGVEPQDVYDFINKIFPNSLGLGVYKNFVHVDDRMDRAYRWRG